MYEWIYWLNMNTDIENTVKQCLTCLDYKPYTTAIKNHELPTKWWEIVDADIFSIINETLLCIVYYYSTFLVVKRADGLSADDLVRATKDVFTEFGLPKKLVSDSGMSFISGQLKQFLQVAELRLGDITSSYNHQSNGQVEACINFVKYNVKYALTTKMMSILHCCIQDLCVWVQEYSLAILLFN